MPYTQAAKSQSHPSSPQLLTKICQTLTEALTTGPDRGIGSASKRLVSEIRHREVEPRAIFPRLLTEFRMAYAKYAKDYLAVDIITVDFYKAKPLFQNYLLCYLPTKLFGIATNADKYRIVIAGWDIARTRYRCPHGNDSRSDFSRLATRAGAALPLCIRQAICKRPEFYPNCPLGWWMTLLWKLNPIPAEGLTKRDGFEHFFREPIWPDPFFASIEAIERCLLHTEHPLFSSGTVPGVVDDEPGSQGPSCGKGRKRIPLTKAVVSAISSQ